MLRVCLFEFRCLIWLEADGLAWLQVKFVKGNSVVLVRVDVEKPICVERFDHVAQLGRFTLRDEGRTIAIGKITKLPRSLKEAS